MTLNPVKNIKEKFQNLINKELYKVRNMDSSKKATCQKIIHGASVAAGTAAAPLAQLPLADNAIITPIQVGMITALGKVFDQKLSDSIARGILSGLLASFAGRGATQLAWGWIPVVGNAANVVTAAGLTELVGWSAVSHFYEAELDQAPYSNNTQEAGAPTENTFERNTSATQNQKWPDIRIKEDIELANAYISGKKSIKDGENRTEASLLADRIYDYLSDKPLTPEQKSELNEIYQKLRDCINKN